MSKITLNYLSEDSKKENHNIMIFIHGYGASGTDLLSLSSYFAKSFPHTKFISPNAPWQIMPNSYYWFPIEHLEPNHLQQGVDKAIPIFDDFIKKIIKETNKNNPQISTENIILCGFSQGSLLALHYALSQKEPLKAVIAFSGGALDSLKTNIKNHTPTCLIHGADDDVLPALYSQKTAQMLKDHNHNNFKLKIIPNLAHNIDKIGIDYAINFLHHCMER